MTTKSQPRVLVIDDDRSLLASVQRALTRYDVVPAASGFEAIEAIATGEFFDVILCDLLMPDMTGAEVYDTLARIAPFYAERLVVMTGEVTEDARRKGGLPSRLLEKPFSTDVLRTVVRKVAGR